MSDAKQIKETQLPALCPLPAGTATLPAHDARGALLSPCLPSRGHFLPPCGPFSSQLHPKAQGWGFSAGPNISCQKQPFISILSDETEMSLPPHPALSVLTHGGGLVPRTQRPAAWGPGWAERGPRGTVWGPSSASISPCPPCPRLLIPAVPTAAPIGLTLLPALKMAAGARAARPDPSRPP